MLKCSPNITCGKTLAHKLLYYIEVIHCLLTQKEVNASPLPLTFSMTFMLSCYYDIKSNYVQYYIIHLIGVTLLDAIYVYQVICNFFNTTK